MAQNTKQSELEALFKNSSLFDNKISEADEKRHGLRTNFWNFYKYKEQFIFCFSCVGSYKEFYILDISLSSDKDIRHIYISITDCLDMAPQEFKDFIIYNLDLFSGIV